MRIVECKASVPSRTGALHILKLSLSRNRQGGGGFLSGKNIQGRVALSGLFYWKMPPSARAVVGCRSTQRSPCPSGGGRFFVGAKKRPKKSPLLAWPPCDRRQEADHRAQLSESRSSASLQCNSEQDAATARCQLLSLPIKGWVRSSSGKGKNSSSKGERC